MQKRDAPEVTYRYYLSDAVFLVGLQSEDESFLRELADALHTPAWPLYLGRCSCPPTQPVVLGIRDLTLDDALAQEPWQAADWKKADWARKRAGELPELPVLVDADGSGYGRAVAPDDPISFDQRDRRFGFRMVEGKKPVTPPDCLAAPGVPTEHDAFAEVEGS